MTFTVAQMSASMTPGGITLTKPKSCQGDKGTRTRESVRDSSLLRFVAPAARPPQRRIGALACEVHGGFRRRERARARERESGWRPRERGEEKQAGSVYNSLNIYCKSLAARVFSFLSRLFSNSCFPHEVG